MSVVIPNGGEVILLDAASGKTPATAWTLRCYTAISPAISNGTVVAHLTEAVGGGYAAIALTAANWVTTPGAPSSSACSRYSATVVSRSTVTCSTSQSASSSAQAPRSKTTRRDAIAPIRATSRAAHHSNAAARMSALVA